VAARWSWWDLIYGAFWFCAISVFGYLFVFRIDLLPAFLKGAGIVLSVVFTAPNFVGISILAVGAIWMMFGGLRRLRDYKILTDTPLIPIRSVSLGFAKIRGKAQSDQLISSPVSHAPCCFYKVKVEVMGDRNWEDCLVICNGHRFFLADDTGKALIDARDVADEDYDVPQSYQCEMDGEVLFAISELRRPARTVEMLSRVDRVLHTHFHEKADRRLAKRKWSDDKYRLQEFLVLPGEEYQVSGTYAENPDSNDPDNPNLICKGDRVRAFAISATIAQSEGTTRRHVTAIVMIVLGAIGTLVLGYLFLLMLKGALELLEK
jgi:hypothetical protein